jgi:hypothetical protein
VTDKTKRPPLPHAWKKGQSGNPDGRPKAQPLPWRYSFQSSWAHSWSVSVLTAYALTAELLQRSSPFGTIQSKPMRVLRGSSGLLKSKMVAPTSLQRHSEMPNGSQECGMTSAS